MTLAESKAFHALASTQLATLERIAREQSFARGQDIFREGETGNGVYVVKEGLVQICTIAANQEPRVFADVPPGDMFGEMAVLELKPRSATARAAQDSVVYFIPRDELLRLVEHSPLLALELLRAISQRLRDFNQRYVQDLLQAERLAVVGRFARAIIHDIKNPLNIISLTAELSCTDRATPEMRTRGSATIRRQVERVSEMIGEILDFTQGARNDVIFAEYDYAEYVGQVLEEIRPELQLKDAVLEFGELPPTRVALDPKRLRRVFHNLLHNATDAMPEGGRIRVRTFATRDEIVTEIEDSGPGIAPEIAGRLFEVFATHGKAHGTGLGLSICKKIVEDHRGRIWTRTQPGCGAIFCFSLPLVKRLGKPSA